MKTFSSPQQKKIYNTIIEFEKENQFFPSYREIATITGLSAVSGIHAHVRNLKDRKFLEKKPNSKREFTIL